MSPPSWFGGISTIMGGAEPPLPPLPGTPTLHLVSTSGLTVGPGSWIDLVGPYTLAGNVGSDVTIGSLNGIVAPNWPSGSTTAYYEDESLGLNDVITTTAWTIAVVARYTGSVTGTATGVTYNAPSTFVDTQSYVGITMLLDATDTTAIRVYGYNYPNYAGGVGPHGSAALAHVIVSQLSEGVVTTQMDGATLGTVSTSPTSIFNPVCVGRGETSATQFQGTIAEVVVWNSGSVSMANIYSHLQSKYGTPEAEFSPLDLSPLGWWRSDLGVTLSTPTTIVALADQSGNGWNLTVNTGAGAVAPGYDTSGSIPAITFTSGVAASLSNSGFPVANGQEYFVVASTNQAVATSNNYLVDAARNAGTFGVELYQSFNTAINITFSQGGGGVSVTPTVDTTFVIDVQVLGTSASSIALDGGMPVTGNVGAGGTSTEIVLGHGGGALIGLAGPFSWSGTVLEVIVFSAPLDDGDRAELLAYFAARYGV